MCYPTSTKLRIIYLWAGCAAQYSSDNILLPPYLTLSLHYMTDALRLSFHSDNDGTGELFAQVVSNGFSGVSSACFGESSLVEFAKILAAAFPLPIEAPLRIQGGFWSKVGGGVEQEHVGLAFYQANAIGRVGCRISLCTPSYEHSRPEEQSSLAVELLTTYERLGVFARALELLPSGGIDEAVLEAAGTKPAIERDVRKLALVLPSAFGSCRPSSPR